MLQVAIHSHSHTNIYIYINRVSSLKSRVLHTATPLLRVAYCVLILNEPLPYSYLLLFSRMSSTMRDVVNLLVPVVVAAAPQSSRHSHRQRQHRCTTRMTTCLRLLSRSSQRRLAFRGQTRVSGASAWRIPNEAEVCPPLHYCVVGVLEISP